MKTTTIVYVFCIFTVLFTTFVECKDMKKFDIAENWEICNKKIVVVEPDDDVKNFEVSFIEKLAELSKDGGGTLHLKKGVYIVSAPVKLPEKTCITGESLEETIVRLDKEAQPFYKKGKGVLGCSKSEHVTVMNLTIDGNKDEQYEGHKYYSYGRYGISFERCNYAWFQNVRAVRNQLIGVYIRGSKSKQIYNAYFDGVYAERNDMHGFKLRSISNATLENSVARDNKKNAIYITGESENVTLHDVAIDKCKYGIVIAKEKGKYPDGVKIDNVDIRNAYKYGVDEKAGKNIDLNDVSVSNKEDLKAKCFRFKYKRHVSSKNTACEVKSATERGSMQCDGGILRSSVCCPISCKICGGSGCSKRGPKKSCCVTAIRKSRKMCTKEDPPCIMG